MADLSELVAASLDHRHGCPDEWSRAPLGSVAKIINGFPFRSGQFGTDGHPVVRIRDVSRGFTNTRFDGDAPDGFWVEPGELVVGMDGDFQSAFWRSDRALLNQRVSKVVPDETKIDRRFLAYALPGYLELINANTPSVTVKHLSSRTMALIPLPLPALARQRLIADRLDELFAEIDKGEAALRQARDDLGTWRKALLKAAVTGELTADWRAERERRGREAGEASTETGPALLARLLAERRARWDAEPSNRGKRYKEPPTPDSDTLPPLPDGWTWATLEQVASPDANAIADGPFGSNLKSSHYTDEGPRVLRLQNIGRDGGFIDASAHISPDHFAALERHHVQAGDLVIAILGDPIPRAVLVPSSVGPALVKADCIKVRLGEVLARKFAWAWLNCTVIHNRLEHQIKGVGRPRLSMSHVREMPMPVPSMEEQAAIVQRLENGLRAIVEASEAIDAQVAAATTLRQSILAAAFRGELA